jgi:hypothetical protein
MVFGIRNPIKKMVFWIPGPNQEFDAADSNLS